MAHLLTDWRQCHTQNNYVNLWHMYIHTYTYDIALTGVGLAQVHTYKFLRHKTMMNIFLRIPPLLFWPVAHVVYTAMPIEGCHFLLCINQWLSDTYLFTMINSDSLLVKNVIHIVNSNFELISYAEFISCVIDGRRQYIHFN